MLMKSRSQVNRQKSTMPTDASRSRRSIACEERAEPMLPLPMMRDWARHLLAYEANAAAAAQQTESPTFLVYEKLRAGLCTLVGIDGFQVLAARALQLAQPQAPSLAAMQVTAEGCLRRLDEVKPQTDSDKAQDGEAGIIFIAHLFGLLLAFLGPATTRQLVQTVFPYLEVVTESGISMPFENMLQEVDQLRSVSDRLENLADSHPVVGDGLVGISENIRDIASILDVFAVIKRRSEGQHEDELTIQETPNYVM
jgi:hypothetical protein